MTLKSFCVLIAFFVVHTHSLDVPLNCHRNSSEPEAFKCQPAYEIQVPAGTTITLICEASENCTTLNEVTDITFATWSSMNNVPTEIFNQLPMLEELDLSHVGITVLTHGDLQGANQLLELYLRHNEIYHLGPNATSEAPQLEWLSLKKNKIESIENGAFTSLSLETIILDENQLTWLKRGMFSGAPKLKKIHLSKNLIESIEGGTFGLPELEEIDLSSNHLKSLPSNLFVNAGSLKVIKLGFNSIESIEEGAFDLPKVEKIAIGGNRLKRLPSKLFANAPHLSALRLFDTQLNQVLDVVGRAQRLKYLDLDDNPSLREQILPRLDRLPFLETLFLNNCSQHSLVGIQPHKLKELSLDDNHFLDKELLEHLKVLKDLRFLSLVHDVYLYKGLRDSDNVKEYFPHLKNIRLRTGVIERPTQATPAPLNKMVF